MPSRATQNVMRTIAIQRVLERSMDRAFIRSLADLRRMYQDEIDANRAEIEAKAKQSRAAMREAFEHASTNIVRGTLRCVVCDGPLPDAKRLSRRYCSGRCRQTAHRLRATAAP